jgi:hypothetical protein
MDHAYKAPGEIGRGARSGRMSVLPRVLGIVGGALLAVGAATPLIHIPIVGTISYLHHPSYFHIYNVGEPVILTAGGLSIILAIIKRFKPLLLTGGIALAQLLTTLFTFHQTVATVVARADQPDLVDPMLMWAGAALEQAHLQWGIWIIGGGAIIAMAAGVWELSRQYRREA